MENERLMNASAPKIVVSEAYSSDALSRLRACGEVVALDSCDDATVRRALLGADALLVRTYTQVTEDLLRAANRLKVVGRAGVGVDNIDLAAAHRRGITVVHTPAASTQSVAEHTVGLMLAVEHQLLAGDRAVRGDRFAAYRSSVTWRELTDCTIGIVGMGRIGSRVGQICATGLGMKVIYNDIRPIGTLDFDATSVPLAELLEEADFVTLHVPLTAQTRGMLNANRLSLMKSTSVLINTSRGAVVDSAVLAATLQRGGIAGAALDVFEDEPIPMGHPLISAPNTILTPHVAGRSSSAIKRMNDVVEDVIAILKGRPPEHPAHTS